jgi:acyl-CoA thioesterase FadM
MNNKSIVNNTQYFELLSEYVDEMINHDDYEKQRLLQKITKRKNKINKIINE